MDLQARLYRYGEMDGYLRECGFGAVAVYSGCHKQAAVNGKSETLIYECSV